MRFGNIPTRSPSAISHLFSDRWLLLRKWAVVRIPYSVSTHYALRTTHSIFVIQGVPQGHGDFAVNPCFFRRVIERNLME